MTIFDKKELTQKDVNELNKLLRQAEFDTLRKASRKLLGDDVDEKELERKFQTLRKKLNKAGYHKNQDTNLYENKNAVVVEEKIIEVEAPGKKIRRSKVGEGNPLRFKDGAGTEFFELLINTQNDDVAWTGTYLMSEVTDLFQLIECGCQIIDTYRLIDASIQLVYKNKAELKRHSFNQDFYELMALNKKNGGSKKQLNLELSQTAANYLNEMLADEFAMFNKTQLINYCMFMATKSAQNSCYKDVEVIDLKARRQERIAKKTTGRKKG